MLARRGRVGKRKRPKKIIFCRLQLAVLIGSGQENTFLPSLSRLTAKPDR